MLLLCGRPRCISLCILHYKIMFSHSHYIHEVYKIDLRYIAKRTLSHGKLTWNISYPKNTPVLNFLIIHYYEYLMCYVLLLSSKTTKNNFDLWCILQINYTIQSVGAKYRLQFTHSWYILKLLSATSLYFLA